MPASPRVLLISGYYDPFSGYQETALAASLSRYADVEVLASDRVSPIFSDAHIGALGVARRYDRGVSMENGIAVRRFASVELRSMVWSPQLTKYISRQTCDLILQIMPGQIMPLAATLARTKGVKRAAFYGDNSAMWAELSPMKKRIKRIVFDASKGVVYFAINRNADATYGYTPDTISRLRRFGRPDRPMTLMPLSYDATKFFLSDDLRLTKREELGLAPHQIVIMAVGKLREKKGWEGLLDAYAELGAERDDLALVMVGADESSYATKLIKRAMAPEFESSVRILPFANQVELNRLYNAADIGVWPRMPAITIQQGMATGLFCLLPRNQYVSHLLQPGTGEYFEEGQASSVCALKSGLKRSLGFLTAQTRLNRATANEWLSADSVARGLLADMGFGNS